MQVIGAGALNQAIKAVAIARTYVSEDGFDIACFPEFSEVTIDGQTRTAIRIVVTRYAEADDQPLAPVVPVITPATETALGQAAATDGPGAPR
jgi:stage V sporulation protein S